MSKEYIVSINEYDSPWGEKFNFEIINGQELIRCKDCKHYNTDLEGFGFCMKGNLVHSRNGEKTEHPDGYCSEPERRENDSLL